MPHPRRSLTIEQWPAPDRLAWTAATTQADPLDEPGCAADWRPKTQHTVSTRYGFWLAWLSDVGKLDPTAPPGARVSREHVAGYLEFLRTRRLASITIAGYIRDLREAIRVMQLGADLSTLDNTFVRLEAVAEPSRAKRLRVVSPDVLVDAAVAELIRQQWLQERHCSRRTAERFRDALIIAFLATRPLRLANLAALTLGKHLAKEGNVYWCRLPGADVKEGEPLEFPMPTALTPWLDRYLAFHRPLLLRNGNSQRLWISIRATPMVDNTIYCRVITMTTGQSTHICFAIASRLSSPKRHLSKSGLSRAFWAIRPWPQARDTITRPACSVHRNDI
jgi:integrase/recombinase XerD